MAVSTVTTAATSEFGDSYRIAPDGTHWIIAALGNTVLTLFYSKDSGATWTQAATTIGGYNDSGGKWHAAFDLDGFLHVYFGSGGGGTSGLYYARGVPNAGKTDFAFTSTVHAANSSTTGYSAEGLVVFRDGGTGWIAFVAYRFTGGGSTGLYLQRVAITSAGAVTYPDGYQATNSNYTSDSLLAFHHTGDGLTVAGGLPHVYLSWSTNISGTVAQNQSRVTATSANTFTYPTLSSAASQIGTILPITFRYDGTRCVAAAINTTPTPNVIQLYDIYESTLATQGTQGPATSLPPGTMQTMTLSARSDGGQYVLTAATSSGVYVNVYNRATTTWTGWVQHDTAAPSGASHGPDAQGNYSVGVSFVYSVGTAPMTRRDVTTAVPSAPTLGPPAAGAYVDLGATPTFGWVYNNQDGSTQASWAFRRKISGAGSYEWWNVGTGAWQSTEVFNTGAASSLTYAAGKWTNGNVYQWSVNTTSTSGYTGTYAADLTVTASAGPVVTVTGPTGTSTTQTPLVTWSDVIQAGLGEAQTTYRVVVEGGGFGTAPGIGVQQYDSGVISSTASQMMVPTALPPNATYRAFVQVGVTGGQVSGWAYSTFTLTLDPPGTPAVTASFDNVLQRMVVSVLGSDNFLSPNAANLETDASGWTAGANTTVARSTAQALNGTASLSLTSTAAGAVSAFTPAGTAAFPVVAGSTYNSVASFRAATTGRACTTAIAWYNTGGTLLSTTTGTPVTSTTTGWTQVSALGAAPSGAAFAAVVLSVAATAAAGEVHYADSIDLNPGTNLVWSRGGLAGSGLARVERSVDAGVTWQAVRGATAVAVPLQQAFTVYDYEPPPGATALYRCTITDVV